VGNIDILHIEQRISAVTVRMKVCGGLGNQLFQYAAGLALARRHRAGLIIDTSYYCTKSHRSFQLNQLVLDFELSPGDEMRGRELFSTRSGQSIFRGTQFRARSKQRADISFSERSFYFDERFFTLTPPVVLQGYYQSARYFDGIDDELRAQISLRRQPCSRFHETLNVIESSRTPVAVHVRRGDLIADERVHSMHGCLGWLYYSRALHIMKRLLDRDHDLFLFGDDLAALRELQGKVGGSFIVSHPDLSAAEDLMLMRKCRSFITANSTFSWWGAWLGEAPDKIVISPRQWFSPSGLRQNNVCDLIPEGWLQI
jgi:Glycosyl transferase family 11